MFRVICFDYRICSVEYFMDEMQPYEMSSIAEYVKYVDKYERENARVGIFALVQPNSKHKIDIKKEMPLPWDEDHTVQWSDEYKEQINEDRKSAMERMKEMEKMFNNMK